MSWRGIVLLLVCCAQSLFGQEPVDGPTNEKAKKTFLEAREQEKKHAAQWALDGFKKADKQDDGHCVACQRKVVRYAIQLGDWKAAEFAAGELVGEAKGERNMALAHFELGRVLLEEGIDKKKEELFSRAHEEFTKAVESYASFPDAIYQDGIVLAHLKQDDAAKACFERYAKLHPADDPERQRALRFASQPELARARMAPPFAVTTLDGKRISLDDMQGKVVLIDFWATWCGPCREALPHMKDLAKKFQEQPLVVLSISLDDDEQKWKDFISKYGMTWPQYRDGGFTGPIATQFGVKAIPHTFTIDADGVLQDEHIGDASIEGKIKKLIARSREMKPAEKAAQ